MSLLMLVVLLSFGSETGFVVSDGCLLFITVLFAESDLDTCFVSGVVTFGVAGALCDVSGLLIDGAGV
jgi:hypothetical protein